MDKAIMRILAVFVAAIVGFQYSFEGMVLTASAAEDRSIVIEKGEDYTIFENSDGTRTLNEYTGDVRIADANGVLHDIDNSVVQSDDNGETVFTNVNGFADVTLPENISEDNQVTVTTEDTQFQFMPIFEGNEDETGGDSASAAEAEELITESVDDLYNNTERKDVGVRYSTPDENIHLEYMPVDAGVKENIVLDRVPDSGVFSFVMKCRA